MIQHEGRRSSRRRTPRARSDQHSHIAYKESDIATVIYADEVFNWTVYDMVAMPNTVLQGFTPKKPSLVTR